LYGRENFNGPIPEDTELGYRVFLGLLGNANGSAASQLPNLGGSGLIWD
jgi:hypothetical protein